MTIRSRLLLLLLPFLMTFLLLISLFFYLNWSQAIISNFTLLMGSAIALLVMGTTVFLVADRISKPVRQLNQAALGIAAGDYEANIHVKGPKEIVELANTLNTMSECLVEHMSRLKESSLIRERMYGEYECALLLQHYMLQKVIDDFRDPFLRLVLISTPPSPLQKGVSLRIDRTADQELMATLIEADEPGFAGLYQLNQWAFIKNEGLNDKAFVECQFLEHGRILRNRAKRLFSPLIWSIKSQQFIKDVRHGIPLQKNDMIFLFNSGLVEQFENENSLEGWFSRVLRHFAEDGLDIIQTMMTNELNFLEKKQHSKANCKIICFQYTG